MPVAALMEKVGGLICKHLLDSGRLHPGDRVGVLVGPGHNGGDALVVARELHLQGHAVQIYHPFAQRKPLTDQHGQYARSLGIPWVETVAALADCDLILDGLFGFGLARAIEGDLAGAIATLTAAPVPIVSIDLPSGIHTDTGAVLGTAIPAQQTLCLGLWKRAFVQEAALAYLGAPTLIDFGLPLADITAVLGDPPQVQRLTPDRAIATLPLNRPPAVHKYQVGHLLLIAGSTRYAGAALLAGQGAVASGVGMLTLAVPESLRLAAVAQLPGALIVGCPETPAGAIGELPAALRLAKYDAIACGPGLTPQAMGVVQTLLSTDRPLLLDADGLNILAALGATETLRSRTGPTVMTPHPGEFNRLFPGMLRADPGSAAQQAAQRSGATIVLKGARAAIAAPDGSLWFNPDSTPALARGGSGDVLTGLIGGLLAQRLAAAASVQSAAALGAALGGVWWHAQAGLSLSRQQTLLGVEPLSLARALLPTLQTLLSPPSRALPG